uniref:Uncharacterized protein n=1 Tax=Methylotuvimicrobium kenyense TaxID=269709 RepID=Q307N6_9GAMM|nr:hypothetical protein [Methylotuvimicrobium kenyense]
MSSSSCAWTWPAQRNELLQQILDREHSSVDRGVAYATNTVTYFFYLIAGASTLLVLLGWTSIRDIKERVQSLADKKILKLVHEYEERLAIIEQQLNKEAYSIEKNPRGYRPDARRAVIMVASRAGEQSEQQDRDLRSDFALAPRGLRGADL